MVVKAAAVQISPVLYSREGTVAKVVQKIRELGERGVQYATFPETVIPYYPYFAFVQPAYAMGAQHLQLIEQAVVVPSLATHAIGEACKQSGMVVSIGVNERDGGSLYNTQLLFDADGSLVQHRRKISPTFHERMIWGQGDGSGLRAVDTAVGRVGQLACWEHYNPLARFALMADGEQIHAAMYPGSFAGDISPSRPRSIFDSTRSNPAASSSTPPRGSIPTSKHGSYATRDVPLVRYRVAALPRLLRRMADCWANHCAVARVKSSPTSTSR